MIYDDDHKPAKLMNAEITVTWIFGISMVGLLLLIVNLSQ